MPYKAPFIFDKSPGTFESKHTTKVKFKLFRSKISMYLGPVFVGNGASIHALLWYVKKVFH